MIRFNHPCNSRCTFCGKSSALPSCKSARKGPAPQASTVDVLEAVRRAGPGPYRDVVISGSEPTMVPDLPEIARELTSRLEAGITLETNARMPSYGANLASLVRSGITKFSLSLYGARPEVHDAVTRVPGSFDLTIGGIRNALDLALEDCIGIWPEYIDLYGSSEFVPIRD